MSAQPRAAFETQFKFGAFFRRERRHHVITARMRRFPEGLRRSYQHRRVADAGNVQVRSCNRRRRELGCVSGEEAAVPDTACRSEEIALLADAPDGSVNSWRIAEPMKWTLASTISF
jgi:hypothetical protein